MARGRRMKPGKCSGEHFRMKLKNGKTRCACAAFDTDGKFSSQFAKTDACPIKGKAITYKQAQKKYTKMHTSGEI